MDGFGTHSSTRSLLSLCLRQKRRLGLNNGCIDRHGSTVSLIWSIIIRPQDTPLIRVITGMFLLYNFLFTLAFVFPFFTYTLGLALRGWLGCTRFLNSDILSSLVRRVINFINISTHQNIWTNHHCKRSTQEDRIGWRVSTKKKCTAKHSNKIKQRAEALQRRRVSHLRGSTSSVELAKRFREKSGPEWSH